MRGQDLHDGLSRSGKAAMNRHAALLLLWTCVNNTRAQAPAKGTESEAKTPYDVQVVLHIVENRFLTPLFQQQLQREIEDRLQLAFGPLAKVKTTRTHPLLGDI